VIIRYDGREAHLHDEGSGLHDHVCDLVAGCDDDESLGSAQGLVYDSQPGEVDLNARTRLDVSLSPESLVVYGFPFQAEQRKRFALTIVG
jgi:hypothetical protein